VKTVESFEEKSLADIAAKQKFSIVDGPFGTQLHASEYKVEGVPVVRVINTSFAGQFNSEKLVFISKKKAEQLKRSKVVPGDIIIAKTGATIGKSGIFPNNFSHGIIASSCIKLTVDQKTADHRFVGYLIQSWEGQNKIIDGAGGSTRTTINTKPFGAIRFLFPSKPEQTKIAEMLSTLDLAIEQTEALIAKQHRIKTGLMQDLLTRGIDEHGNLRSKQTHQFKDSSQGRIPVEWTVKPLGTIIEVIDCKHYTPSYVEEGIPIIRPRNIKDSGFDLSDLDFVTERDYALLTDKHEPIGSDIVFSRNASFGVPVYVEGIGRFCIGQDVVVMRKIIVNTRLIFFALKSERVVSQIMNASGGSTFGRIDLGAIRDLNISFPESEDEQVEVATRLVKCDEYRKIVEVQLEKLRHLKTALMQDLLTGKKRVTTLLKQEVASA